MREPVAIVGMGAVFPGAPDLGAYWSNIERGLDAITAVPPARLDPIYFAGANGFACRRGGFVEATFDPIAFGIMPVAAAGAEPDQLLALHVAAAALDDAGGTIPRERTGVILGRGGYLTPGMARLSNRVRTAQQLATTLGELLPDLDAATVERIRAAFAQRAGELGPAETKATDAQKKTIDAREAIGLVPNLAASRIANRLDLRGPAYTVDAACASSLLAIDQACRELADRRCDMVIAGGVHVCHDVTFWSVFTELGALSKSSQIRPFDRRADGIVIGEGAGIVILKRLVDAERDGDRIYATILGTGISSDGRESSAMRPRADGQLAAIDAAWRAAARDPSTVGIVEAHGTATPTGDEVELTALAQFFGETTGARAGVGSVKSMIGHAMPAAGVAGLIKSALAIHHGVMPPSLHCEEPHEALARTRFRVLDKAEPWTELPRRAGISAFGFGGINAHVVIEAHQSATTSSSRIDARSAAGPEVLALVGDSIDALRAGLDNSAPRVGGGDSTSASHGTLRLAMLDPTPERRALARKVLDRGRAWRGNHDIWFTPRGLAADGGKLVFVFPGIEATFAAKVDDIARDLGVATPPEIVAASAAGIATARDLEIRGAGAYALGRLLAAALDRLGIAPDAIAGHSMGEWTGMVASEMIPPAAADAFVRDLQAGSLEVPDVVFAAVGCSADGAAAALDGLDDISVSHDNCPHQSIVCGRRDRVRIAIERLGKRGVLCQELPFRSGFHSPLFADYLAPHRRHLATLALQPPRVPLWSATTAAPYPAEADAIRAIAIDHLVQPVKFRALIENLYAAGFRAFVQLGVGSLGGFVDDTLRGRDHLAIAAASAQQPGRAQLARTRAALFADGFVDNSAPPFGGAAGRAQGPTVDQIVVADTRAKPVRSQFVMQLGVPLVRLDGVIPPLTLDTKRPPSPDGDPVLAELVATLDEAAAASRAVVDAYRAKARPSTLTIKRTLSVDRVPALIDHCFYRQPPGWSAVSDLYPVVPMTMTIGMMVDAARALRPELVPIAVEDIRALRWMAVEPSIEISLLVNARGADHASELVDGRGLPPAGSTPEWECGVVDVEIPGYARATVRLAAAYPAAPSPALAPLTKPRPAPHSAAQMYADRWMFHGPQYQGVVGLGPVGDDGVDGVIDTLPAPGALLDCAGQLMGWWVMQSETRDRLAMPVVIARIELYGAHPVAGERLDCRVRMRGVGEREARADLELAAHGRVWARITGWEDRRFDSDDAVWAVLMYPERNVLAVAHEDYVKVGEHWRGAASRELMMRRYLSERERAEHDQVGPRGKRGWLLGRIAIKDAVRMHRWATSATPIWPVEIGVRNEPSGRPVIDGDLRVSVAHKDDLAVAIVGDGHDVGIDLERVEPRTETFTTIAYTQAELELGAGRERDDWMARLWAAKEAVAKLRGTGMTDPKKLVARAVAGDRLTIDDTIVDTRRDGDYVIAWCKQ